MFLADRKRSGVRIELEMCIVFGCRQHRGK